MPRLTIRTVRREYLLDVAERLLAERGWAGLTFAAICQAAEVSNGLLTHHFTDKEDLLFALFERTVARRKAQFRGQLTAPDQPLEARLRNIIAVIAAKDGQKHEFHLLMLHFLSLATGRPQIAERIHASFTEFTAVMTTILAEEMARGTLPARDPQEAAVVVVRAILGMSLMPNLPDHSSEEGVLTMVLAYLHSSPSANDSCYIGSVPISLHSFEESGG